MNGDCWGGSQLEVVQGGASEEPALYRNRKSRKVESPQWKKVPKRRKGGT